MTEAGYRKGDEAAQPTAKLVSWLWDIVTTEETISSLARRCEVDFNTIKKVLRGEKVLLRTMEKIIVGGLGRPDMMAVSGEGESGSGSGEWMAIIAFEDWHYSWLDAPDGTEGANAQTKGQKAAHDINRAARELLMWADPQAVGEMLIRARERAAARNGSEKLSVLADELLKELGEGIGDPPVRDGSPPDGPPVRGSDE